jgi:hypothetical protein
MASRLAKPDGKGLERDRTRLECSWLLYRTTVQACSYYLPRLASLDVLTAAIGEGIANINWHADTFAYAEGHDGTRWAGLTILRVVQPLRCPPNRGQTTRP